MRTVKIMAWATLIYMVVVFGTATLLIIIDPADTQASSPSEEQLHLREVQALEGIERALKRMERTCR